MPKAWNPADPPISLAESEGMLDAERRRLKSKDEWRALGWLLVGGLSILALVCAALYWAFVIFRGAGRLFS